MGCNCGNNTKKIAQKQVVKKVTPKTAPVRRVIKRPAK